MTTITIDKPGYPASGAAFHMSGKLSGYTATPKLSYADDPTVPGKVTGVSATETKNSIALKWSAPTTGATYKPLPSGSTVSKTAFSFQHPGLTPGHHTVVVTDGKAEGSVGFGISNAAHAKLNPFR